MVNIQMIFLKKKRNDPMNLAVKSNSHRGVPTL